MKINGNENNPQGKIHIVSYKTSTNLKGMMIYMVSDCNRRHIQSSNFLKHVLKQDIDPLVSTLLY